MKCESCDNELTGGAIICRVCNHNNALRGGEGRLHRADDVQEIIHRRVGDAQPNASRASLPLTELPKIVPRKDADNNLIHFPAVSNKLPASTQPAPKSQVSTEDDADATAFPPWRAQLKEKVRQMREKRNAEMPADEPDEAELDPNPIVESALKRISWATHAPAITTSISASRQGARAAALARLTLTEPEAETQTKPEPRPESGIVSPRPNQVAIYTVNRHPVNRVETRTLTPKVNRDASAKPEPKTAPSSDAKVLRPRTPHTKDQTTAELRTEPGYAQRKSAVVAVKPDKHFETQIIEISQAPEPLPLPEAEPASLWVRTLAGACDFEVIAAAYLPIFGAYAMLDTSLGSESFFIMLVLLSAITFVYQLVTLLIAGRTTGMALLDLNLLNADDEGLPVTRRQKMLRAWAAPIAFLCPPLNLIVTRLNHPHRSLPDLISGTTVAKE